MSPDDEALIARARELATAALHAAMREDWTGASKAMRSLSEETGSNGVMFAVLRYCDTIIGRQLAMRGLPDDAWDGGVRMAWLNVDHGTLGHAGQVPDSVRWAGQLVAARAAKDEAAFRALIGAMPDDDGERGKYVGELLRSCAITANMAKAQGAV